MNVKAIVGSLNEERKRITKAIDALTAINGHRGRVAASKPKRVLSASARKRIAEAQRARWARVKRISKAA